MARERVALCSVCRWTIDGSRWRVAVLTDEHEAATGHDVDVRPREAE